MAPTTMLYIEDNPLNRRLLVAIMRHRPTTIMVEATNGTDGMRLAREIRPDWVLLDLNLPDIDGEDVLSNFRMTFPNMPVVILTADAWPERHVRLLARGASVVMVKPFDVQHMLALVDELTVLPSG